MEEDQQFVDFSHTGLAQPIFTLQLSTDGQDFCSIKELYSPNFLYIKNIFLEFNINTGCTNVPNFK